MQRHEDARNPDGMPCEFSGRDSAKNWYYWVESDAAGDAVGHAVGRKRRHWYAAGGDGCARDPGLSPRAPDQPLLPAPDGGGGSAGRRLLLAAGAWLLSVATDLRRCRFRAA